MLHHLPGGGGVVERLATSESVWKASDSGLQYIIAEKKGTAKADPSVSTSRRTSVGETQRKDASQISETTFDVAEKLSGIPQTKVVMMFMLGRGAGGASEEERALAAT